LLSWTGSDCVRALTKQELLSIKLGIVAVRAKDAVDIEFLRSLDS
jgi:hypothetical protein